MSNNISLSSRIKELRTSMGLTQKEFAELINVSTVSVSSYETEAKTPSLDMVISISRKCNVSIDWLCGLSDKKNLNDECCTYYDAINFLVKLCSTKYEETKANLLTPNISKDNLIEYEYINFATTCDDVIVPFFKNWKKMYNLLEEKVINSDIYNQWLEGELSKYKDHAIDGIPF